MNFYYYLNIIYKFLFILNFSNSIQVPYRLKEIVPSIFPSIILLHRSFPRKMLNADNDGMNSL